MAPLAELVNDLVGLDVRGNDRPTDLQGLAELRADDVGRETVHVLAFFRAADRDVQGGAAIAAIDVDRTPAERGTHELEPFGQGNQIGHHVGGRRVVDPGPGGGLGRDEFLQRKMISQLHATLLGANPTG